jgi:hypothetical protein
MRAENKEKEFTELLLSGKGIKKDAGGHDFYKIVERKDISSSNGCVVNNVTNTKSADVVLKKVLKQLEKDGYVVMTKASQDCHNGRFKATTYYLAEA